MGKQPQPLADTGVAGLAKLPLDRAILLQAAAISPCGIDALAAVGHPLGHFGQKMIVFPKLSTFD
jgi:hypothetical protein